MRAGDEQGRTIRFAEVAERPHGGENEVRTRDWEEGERVLFAVENLSAGARPNHQTGRHVQLIRVAAVAQRVIAEAAHGGI